MVSYPALYIVHCWVEFTGSLLDSVTVQNRKSARFLFNGNQTFWQSRMVTRAKNKLTSNMFILLSKIRHRGEEGIQEAAGFRGNLVQMGGSSNDTCVIQP